MPGVVTPVVSPNAYANDVDFAAYWRALSEEEKTRSNSLLKLASNRLRTIADNQSTDLDEKVNESPSYFVTVQWVVMEAAKRAMLTPTDTPPANSVQQTAGPYSSNIVFTNPAGDLWFKKSELHDLGFYGNQRLNAISTSARDIYSPYPTDIESS
jgi:hypothetical protein